MKSGDNIAMGQVEDDMAKFIENNPVPAGLDFKWSGLTYINKIWQDLMVKGMLKAVLGGFVVVFLLMVVLFKSLRLSIVSMIPLTCAIVLSYGLVGVVGKDYDMPIAVCSSLSLGLAVDFAIHFIQRFKDHYQKTGSLEEANRYIMGEPGRAIMRNAIVITLGFLPLVFSTLVPYITVGLFFAILMFTSAVATLVLLPALIRMGGDRLFRGVTVSVGYIGIVLGVLSLGYISPGSVSAEMGAREIIQKSHVAFYGAGDQMKAKIEMRLINAKGRERRRKLTMLRKNTGRDEQKYFIYFYSPGDVRGMTFMVWKYPGRDDERWLFVPALNLVRRIAAKDSHSSFVGSDFTYEDVSGRDIDLDTYTLLKEATIEGHNCYVVESRPKNGTAGYTRKVSWIDKETFLPIKEEYYDLQGRLGRVFRAMEIEEIEGIPTVTRRLMENVRRKHKTEVVFRDVTYKLSLPDRLFTERYLRRPPERWVR